MYYLLTKRVLTYQKLSEALPTSWSFFLSPSLLYLSATVLLNEDPGLGEHHLSPSWQPEK